MNVEFIDKMDRNQLKEFIKSVKNDAYPDDDKAGDIYMEILAMRAENRIRKIDKELV